MYKPTIGLEIHAELNTRTKMFCGCKNDPEEKRPNVNICPICTGHPGTLPVANKDAIRRILKLGFALGAKIPTHSKFDRKNYFYPDLPKGYQISQYDEPLVKEGELHGIRITRVHLEEDAGRLIHLTADKRTVDKEKASGSNVKGQTSNVSFVDYNRAGLPLMELVTEPDVKDAESAVAFARELQLILRYCGVSNADMERGQMRVEANISIAPAEDISVNQRPHQRKSAPTLGTKVEIKNLNSFRAVHDAIFYEIKRQEELLERGEKVVQETRGWDENKKITVSQRLKEEAHDYRYFPEPDLPPLNLEKLFLESIKREVPELPKEKRTRFAKEYKLNESQIEILIEDRALAEFFEESVSELALRITRYTLQDLLLLFNYLTSDLRGLINERGIALKDSRITPSSLADLIGIIVQENLPSRMAKDILREMVRTGLDPHQIMKEKGLGVISDAGVIETTINEVLAANPKAVEDYKKGKENALQFLIGQAMGKLKGQAKPDQLKEEFKKKVG